MSKVPVSFRFTKQSIKNLKERATEEHRSMSAHLEYLIEQDAKYARIPVLRVDDISQVRYSDAPADKED